MTVKKGVNVFMEEGDKREKAHIYDSLVGYL